MNGNKMEENEYSLEEIIKNDIKCQIKKSITEFYKCESRYDGLQSICKDCGRMQMKKYYIKTKLIYSLKAKKYYRINKKKLLNRRKKWYLNNTEDAKKYKQEYQQNNKEKIKDYYLKNKKQIIKNQIQRQKIRLKTDINYKLKIGLKNRVRLAIKHNQKSGHTLELLGCDIEFLKKHLEAQFKDGMNWENYGFYGWHIDHIRPCVSFNLSKPEEQKNCFHYTNLQPLWASDNLSKNDKWN